MAWSGDNGSNWNSGSGNPGQDWNSGVGNGANSDPGNGSTWISGSGDPGQDWSSGQGNKLSSDPGNDTNWNSGSGDLSLDWSSGPGNDLNSDPSNGSNWNSGSGDLGQDWNSGLGNGLSSDPGPERSSGPKVIPPQASPGYQRALLGLPTPADEDVPLTHSGTVKVWFEEKGFGFISNDDGSGETFVQRPALTDGSRLEHGAKVMFAAQWNPQRQQNRATKVTGATNLPPPEIPNAMVPGKGQPLNEPSANLYITALPLGITEQGVTTIFSDYGTVASVKVLASNGRADAAAMVKMSSLDEAKWIQENLNNNTPKGLNGPIYINYAKRQKGDGKGAKGLDRYNPYVVPPALPMQGKGSQGKGKWRPLNEVLASLAQSVGQSQDSWDSFGKGKGADSWDSFGKGKGADSWDSFGKGKGADSFDSFGKGKGGGANLEVMQGGQGKGAPRERGRVKVWFENNGCGFIMSDAGTDHFVHRSNLAHGERLDKGATVSFEPSWDYVKNKAIAIKCRQEWQDWDNNSYQNAAAGGMGGSMNGSFNAVGTMNADMGMNAGMNTGMGMQYGMSGALSVADGSMNSAASSGMMGVQPGSEGVQTGALSIADGSMNSAAASGMTGVQPGSEGMSAVQAPAEPSTGTNSIEALAGMTSVEGPA